MQQKISTLPQLIDQLKSSTKEEYKDIGVDLDIPVEEFRPYAFWSSECYTRNCIIREEDFELILLCWEPDQGTSIHCHGGEECWVYVLEGNIEESHYKYQEEEIILDHKLSMRTGDKSFMSDELGYHMLKNNSLSRSLSLHLYMNPIDNCTVYNKSLKEFVPRSLTYHSYQGVKEGIEV